MDKIGEIHPWALIGITLMVCITLISLAMIFTRQTAATLQENGQLNSIQAGGDVPVAQGAPALDPALNDAPAGGGSCGSGGCGCGGG